MKLTSVAGSAIDRVSHNDAILKRVLLGAGELPGGVRFSLASFQPGERAPAHAHEDLVEVFYVLSGCGEVELDGERLLLEEGSCLRVDPGEMHEVINSGATPLDLLYFALRSGPDYSL